MYFNVNDDTNPIFSSYNVRSVNFKENMDEFVKAPNDILIEERYNKKQEADNKADINKTAIDNIPQYPDWLNEEYNEINKTPEWFRQLQTASDAEREEWKRKGKMGLVETIQRHNYWYSVPWAGTTGEATMLVRTANTLRRIKNGENVSDTDLEILSDFIKDTEEMQVRGGHTWLGNGAEILLNAVPYVFEVAGGLATSEGGVGLAAIGKTLSTIGAKKAARKAVQAAIKEAAIKSAAPGATKKALTLSAAKKIYKDTLLKTSGTKALAELGGKEILKGTIKSMPKALATTYKAGKLWMPQSIAKNTANRQLATGFYVTDEGEKIFTQSENLALSLMKAFGETTFEGLTETSGWAFSPIAKYFAKPIQKKLPKKFFSGFEKLVSNRYGKPAADVLRKYGYDGVLEEMGEELLNRFLCQTFGINGLDEYNFDGFMNNVFYASDPSQWGSEALSFAVMSAGGHALTGSASKIAEEWDKKGNKKELKRQTELANQYIFSPEKFYLDQGLIKIPGSQSLAEQKLRDIWISKNIDAGLQDDILRNMSESEIRSELEKEIREDNLVNEKAVKEKQDEVETTVYNKLLKGGVQKDVAYQNAKLFGQFYKRYGAKHGEAFDNWFKKFDVEYNVPAAERNSLMQNNASVAGAEKNEIAAAQKEWNEKGTDSKYFKKWFGKSKVVDEQGKPLVVYHGSPNIFEIFNSKKSLYGEVSEGFNFFTNKKSAYQNSAKDYAEFAGTDGFRRNGKVYETYLSIKNPLHIKYTSNSMSVYNGEKRYSTPVEYYDANYKSIKEEYSKGDYDGIIIENTDKNDDDSIIYLVPNSEQIKSIDNRGTFDEDNPNIFYQKDSEQSSKPKFIYNMQELLKKYNYSNNVYFKNKTESIPDKDKKQIEKFKDTVDEIVKRINKNESNFGINKINLGYTPKKLQEAGLSNKKIKIDAEVITKAMNEKNVGHTLYPETIKVIPELLHNPIVVMKSISEGHEDDSVVVITDAVDNNDKNVIVAIRLNVNENKNDNKKNEYIINEIMSVHGRSNIDYVFGKTLVTPHGIKKIDRNKMQVLHKFTTRLQTVAVVTPATYSITDNADNFNPDVKKHEENGPKTYYQENDTDEENLFVGFTYPQIMDKLMALNEKLADEYDKLSQAEKNSLMAKIHVLEDAFEASQHPEKFSNEEHYKDIMLNTYYIMNDQEIPDEYVDTDKISERTHSELLKIHNEKKEQKEKEYLGYFTSFNNENIITIMENHDSSTALHELGHLFLNGLNELAKVDSDAKLQLEAVNKWLGFSGEYTVEQQEKFARSFEAYLYKGKAPNNYLREVFESFKEWLKSVYQDISELVRKGADISDEVQEMFDNIFADDTYYQERKQINELLKKTKKTVRKERIEKINVRDDSKLDERAKRHKEACYEILSAGTGKSVKYLKTIFETSSNKKSFAKKREAIETFLESVEDNVKYHTGMQSNWREFFTDPGISYETDELDADRKLVEQALDVIINKSYGIEFNAENELEERALYFKNSIDKANKEYKILLSSFKNGNRNVALGAVYEWLSDMPPEIKQDFEDRFIYDAGIIERNEHVDKFDKAKRDIVAKALELNNKYKINENEKYQETVKEIIKSLNFLQPTDKARLTANILDVPSTAFLMSSIDNILDVAKTMEDVQYRRKLEKEIHKELQGTKNVRKNGRSVGKFNYQFNKLFEELRKLDRLTPEQANEQRLENKKFAEAEDSGLSYADKVINKFLSYKAGGRTFADTDLMKDLYDEILKIKLAGKSAKSEQDMMEQLSEEKDIDELIDIIQNKKEAKTVTKMYINGFGNLESIINALFNKDIKERYASDILYDETQAQAWQYEQKKTFEEAVAKIYNVNKNLWDMPIIKRLSEKHTYIEYRRKYDEKGNVVKVRNINRTLSKMDIIQAFIWSKNEVLEKRLLNQFGEEQLDEMFSELSQQDIELAELMIRMAQSYYPLVNKAYIDKYGLDLPKVSCYFPSTPERGSEVDLYNDYSSKSLGNGFTKSRANSEILPMDFHNPVATLYSHIDGVAKFAFMAKNLDAANIRFRNNDLKRAVIDKYGEDAFKSLEQSLMNVTYKKEAPVFNSYQKALDTLVSNWIQANVAIKPIVGLKQLLSANNYALDMPYMTWQIGFLKALAQPKATIDYMMKIPYLRARYGGSYSNEFLKQTIENSKYAATKKLKDLCSVFIKMGDIGAIIFGGKPYIDYLIKEKGMSESDAIKQFILSTNRSQQSSAISSLSNFQVAASRSPIGRLFVAYKNSPQQYFRMCGDALISAANGDITKAEAARIIFQFGYLQPFLYAAATSGAFFRLFFTGDDDDLWNDLKVSLFNLGTDAMPLLGEMYKYAVQRLFFKEKYVATTTPLFGDVQNEIGKLAKDDIEAKDFFEAIAYMLIHVGAGYNTKAIQTEASGVGDIVTGKADKGLMKVLGYTDKRAKRITEE